MTQSPCTWTFDWLTQPAGLLLREETGWVLRGRPNTSPADDGWLVAHDVFHHRPDDTGSYSDEVATFGAETWLDEPFKDPDDLQRSLTNSWLSVCLMTLEQGTRGAEGLRVKTRIDPTALGHPQAGMWRGCMKMALREAQEVLGEYGDPETWAALSSDEHCDRLLSLVAGGYRQAAERWPDRAQAREWFTQLAELSGPGEPGAQLHVTWDGRRMDMRREEGARPRAGCRM